MPSTACEGGVETKLFSLIRDLMPNANLATVQRKYFNESKGLLIIRVCVCVCAYCVRVHACVRACGVPTRFNVYKSDKAFQK